MLRFSAVVELSALAHLPILCLVWPLSGLAICYHVSVGALGCATQDPVPQDHHTLVHDIVYAILVQKNSSPPLVVMPTKFISTLENVVLSSQRLSKSSFVVQRHHPLPALGSIVGCQKNATSSWVKNCCVICWLPVSPPLVVVFHLPPSIQFWG